MGVMAVAMLAMGEALAHVGTHPSVHDTVVGILDRFGRTRSTNELKRMKVSEALALITAKEREVLGSEHVLFRVNVPTLVPVLGNHEYQGGEPKLYLHQFALMRNGSSEVPLERAYSFRYSDAQIVVLDSNLAPSKQTNWLAKELSESKATWNFVTYQVLGIQISGNRLNYRAFDLDGVLRDQFVIEK